MIVISAKTNEYMKEGKPVFVYSVTSDATDKKVAEKELDAYKTSQGTYYRESESKEPLYFSQRSCEPGAVLKQTNTGRFQVLLNLEDKAASIENKTDSYLAKFQALQQYTGKSKQQLALMLLETL